MPFLELTDTTAKVHHTDTGDGSPPVVFVHGTGGSLRDFDAQVGHFRHRHRAVAVDLPGHGASDNPPGEYTFPVLAANVSEVCRHLELHRPVLVGHSMGGTIALDLAAREPDLPSALVMLDAPILLHEAAIAGYRDAIEALHGPDYDQLLEAQVRTTAHPVADDRHLDHYIRGHRAVPPEIMLSILRNGIEYIATRTEEAIAECRVPLLYIGAGPSAPGSQIPGPGIASHVNFKRFHELASHLTVGQTVGTGHHHHIAAPNQINTMIERWLAITLERSPTRPKPEPA